MEEFGLPTSFGRHNQKKRFPKNTRRSNKKPQILNYLVDVDVEAVFNKRFSFFNEKKLNKSIFKLPEPSSLFQEEKWDLQQFQHLKTILNDTKSKLNDLNLKEWHFHTTNTNIAGDVMKKLRYTLGPEFLTQAWCKMYECLSEFLIVPEQLEGGQFNSVHLCEAPGAFISALNHFLQTWYPDTQWDWLATTLNPFHESNTLSHMIQDDRFILHTLDHWTFGRDGTGNLMDPDNLAHLQEQVDNRLSGKVMLVTADGSIDCQINPAEQESIVAPLHYCETLTALSILQPGGSFVLKMFTLLECESICLLYLLACTFNTVNVFKPVKSKEGNSEVYVVCTEYIGREKMAPWLPTLLDKFGSTNPKAMFAEEDIPEEFKKQVFECAKMFTELQIQVIERNLDMFYFPTLRKQVYSRLMKEKVADAYLQHYEMKQIDKYIVGNHVLTGTPSFNLAQKQEEGTFNDRVRRAAPDQPHEVTVHQLWQRVVEVSSTCVLPCNDQVCWFVLNTKPMPEVQLTIAQPVTEICSSKFCNGRLLEVYCQLNCPQLQLPMRTELLTSTTVDVSGWPWFKESTQCNLQLLEQISTVLQALPVAKSLCIRGLPLLTQFSVAVVVLLAHSFYQVGLTVEGDVILCGYQQALGNTEWISSVLERMSRLPVGEAILSLLPINILCDPSYSTKEGVTFYLCVSRINNALLLRSIQAEVYRILHNEPATQSDMAIIQCDPKKLQSNLVTLHSNPEILQSDPAIIQCKPLIQSDPAILQSKPMVHCDYGKLHSDPAIIQSDPAIFQIEPMIQSDPAILQSNVAIQQNDPAILQSEPMIQSDPAILQSNVAIQQSDPAILRSEPMIQSDPAILESKVAIQQSDPTILHSNVAIQQSDPAILKSEPMIQSDPAIFQSNVAIQQSDSAILQSKPMFHSDPVVLKNDPMIKNEPVFCQSDPMTGSDPARLQTNPQTDAAILQSDTAIFQSGPVILQSDFKTPNIDPAILKSDLMANKTNPAIVQSGPPLIKSESAILKSNTSMLRSETSL